MIDNYDFIDSNGSGDKEVYVNGAKQLLNKLSAQEINLLRNKVNEIIANSNASAVPLYGKYTLAFKGDTNISLDTLQAGDVVARYYDGAINYYTYNGGDVNDDASYSLIGGLSSTQIGKFVDTYISGAQDFTLPDFAQIISVFVRGHRTENYTVSSNVITINNTIGSGSEVVILYLEDLATGIAPYYTQVQVDALIAGVGGGGGAESGEWTPTISALSNVGSAVSNSAYWTKIGNFVTLNYSASLVLSASGLLSFEITVPTAYPITSAVLDIGNGVLQNNGFTAVLCQKATGTTKVSIQSKATVSGSLNAIIQVNITYKTT